MNLVFVDAIVFKWQYDNLHGDERNCDSLHDDEQHDDELHEDELQVVNCMMMVMTSKTMMMRMIRW